MRSLIFAGLLALQIVLSACDKPEIILKNEGARLDLNAEEHPGKLLNCTLETNSNKVYSIYPDQELNGEYTGRDKFCSYVFRTSDFSYAGLWTMTTITDKDKYADKITVRVQRKVTPVPTDTISAYAGQWIYITLDTNETNVRSCNVTSPSNHLTFNLLADKVENLSLWGTCGVRMLASKSVEGQWEIHSQVGEYLSNYASFHIDIPWQSVEETVEEVVKHTWVIGEKNQQIDWYDPTLLFCEFERPDGTKLPRTYGSCKMQVSVVSAHHEGTWRASYATKGKIELEHKEIVIKTRDESFLECSYSAGVGEEINLLCTSGENSLSFCTFIRPDKYVINLPAGVGNENYTYYGKGFGKRFGNREYAECGVTIRKPSNVDFGVWTCEMGIADGITGSVIKVPRTRAGEIDRKSDIENPTVYVKRGDSFEISCKGFSKLKYCWLSSPNGTAYSVSAEGSSGKSFKYVGNGFTMGECGATVPTSNDTDSGNWICHLGYAEGFEVEQTVPVKVTDSYLIADNDVVRVTKSAKLTCRTFIGEDGTVKYCRWVRPNGYGINILDASRYQLSQGVEQCGLTILDFQPEDVGKWTCRAALTRFSDREEWATIELRSIVIDEAEISSVLMIVLGSGILVFTLIGASYAAVFVFRNRNIRAIKDPPPYYPKDYTTPDEIRTDPIPNKNDRF